MIRSWHLPQSNPRVSRLEQPRVAQRDVAIRLPVNQKNRDAGVGDNIRRRSMFKIEVIPEAGDYECHFDHRPQKGSSRPRPGGKMLTHAVVSNLSKSRERRFCYHGAEIRLDIQSLQQLRGTHGLSKAINTMWVVCTTYPLKPPPNVVTFEQSVSSKIAAALAMRARIGHEYRVSVHQEELRIPNSSQSVVAESV